MHRVARFVTLLACAFALGASLARAEAPAAPDEAIDPAKEAMMAAMQQYGSPNDNHKALEPFVGAWNYTAQWWMAPDAPPQSMTGTATNSLMFGGRFLKQEIFGEAPEGQPPFEGLGFIGHDNLRQEYQSVWFDNMATGMMVGDGAFDGSTNTLSEAGSFSCPITGKSHRTFRSMWTLVDADHTTYETYMSTPEGMEFKAMEIRYSRNVPVAVPCPEGLERC